VFSVTVGPVGFRVGSAWPAPVAALAQLYAGYPGLPGGIADFTVRLEPTRPWRRWLRPAVSVRGDYALPDTAPLPLRQGLLAAEMGMNLQMALGARRWLLLHASCVERGGRALLMSGHSGAGKSTLSALLGERGWRLLGDEFVLLDPVTGLVHPFPRPVSLKNGAIAVMAAEAEEGRFGPLIPATPKGDIRHLRPNADALARMREPARPALLLFPQYGQAEDARPVGAVEAFVRLTQASTNYVALGETGFRALTGLVAAIPALGVDYPDTAAAVRLVETLWARATG
ncbi:MAG: HprK-related kinase A, partial [Sphingomonas sp.]